MSECVCECVSVCVFPLMVLPLDTVYVCVCVRLTVVVSYCVLCVTVRRRLGGVPDDEGHADAELEVSHLAPLVPLAQLPPVSLCVSV